jgi:hypothetical protein
MAFSASADDDGRHRLPVVGNLFWASELQTPIVRPTFWSQTRGASANDDAFVALSPMDCRDLPSVSDAGQHGT